MGIVRAQRTAGPLLRSSLALLAVLTVPCLVALLVGWPSPEKTGAESHGASSANAHAPANSRGQRAPDSMPLGLVWGACCASLIGLGLLSVSLQRRSERHARPGREHD